MDILETITAVGVVPVLKLDRPERDAAPLARALCRGGVPVAEVTFRAPGAADAMARMRAAEPDLLVGAGTVVSTAQIDEALAAGAQFLVSPGLDPALIEYCQSRQVPLFPGCTTATEYHTALRLGLPVLKFFPAEQSGGVEKIKALAAPFPQFRILPTGGITLENLARYLACPAVCACGGTFMAPPRLIEAQQWDEITALCRRSREIVEQAR
jgi:2-dehydro-3-deoxyphosphogluconate aldolase/(4S)-4-hydroxy-2-oxoglutarate aldolase